jgi:hypothetical protein
VTVPAVEGRCCTCLGKRFPRQKVGLRQAIVKSSTSPPMSLPARSAIRAPAHRSCWSCDRQGPRMRPRFRFVATQTSEVWERARLGGDAQLGTGGEGAPVGVG